MSMSRSNYEAQIDDYNFQISAKECEQDELRAEQRQIMDVFEDFNENIVQSFTRIEAIEVEVNRRGNQQNQYNEIGEQRLYFSRRFARQEEELTEAYNKAYQTLEDEREALQRKRDVLFYEER